MVVWIKRELKVEQRMSEESRPTSPVATFEFITPTPINKPDEDGERGTGYNYECDTILDNYEIPKYNIKELKIAAPFSYQVAGHDPFLKAHGGLLCKPFVPRELWFYLEVQQNYQHYKPFIADFKGCVDFSTEQIREFASSLSQFDSKVTKKENYITPWAEKVHQGHLQRITSPKSTSRLHHILFYFYFLLFMFLFCCFP